MQQRDGTQAWREVLAGFERWLAAPTEDRDALLAEFAAQRPDLASRLQAMIDADRAAEADGFLDTPADFTASAAAAAPTLPPPSRLGPWQLREVIGAGGMGQVWLAERSDGLYHGRAAVKMLSAGLSNPASAARFAREGELLARLEHPHIARLLDAGLSDDGHRYLVLEYVRGERIDTWCDARSLGLDARLALFMQVCDAVAFAHANLVVHRDLKPANILVTDEGEVKLLDFGVAKLLEDDDAADLTRAGSAGLTPDYAAPEQISGEPIGTATDVYALGVVLFRLLSGARPYAAATGSAAALAREIVDGEPRALSRAWGSDDAAWREAADARSTTPQRLRQALAGDLETIVAKAMRKAPSERYGTVPELRDDMQRHRRYEPIAARQTGLAERAAKFVRRHRIQVGALAAVFAALALGAAAATWQWQSALREAERTRAVVKVLTDLFTGLSPDESGRAQVSVLELLQRGWAQARSGLADDPQLQGEVARPLGLLLTSSGDVANAAEALAVSRSHLVAGGRTRSPEYLDVALELGHARRLLGDTAAARALYEEVLAVARALADPRDDHDVFALGELGAMAHDEGQLDDARAQLNAAVQEARSRFGVAHAAHVKALTDLASIEREQGRWREARELLVAVVDASAGGKPVNAAVARYELANIDVDMGRYAAAVEPLQALAGDMQRLLGAQHRQTIFTRVWLGVALFHTGRTADSRQVIAQAHADAGASGQANVRHTVQVAQARMRLRLGEVDAAEPPLRESLAHFESVDEQQQPAAARVRALLGECALRRGRVEEAVALLERAAQAQLALFGEVHRDRWPTLLLLALAHDAAGHAPAALAAYDAARRTADAVLAPEHPDRLRLRVFELQAHWRHAPQASTNAELLVALESYRTALAARSETTAIAVLTDKVAAKHADAISWQSDILALLSY